jgi:hypothetical protein
MYLVLVNLVASCLGTEEQTVVEELVARSRAGDQDATTTLADKCTGLPCQYLFYRGQDNH